jgi:hypothetical protein
VRAIGVIIVDVADVADVPNGMLETISVVENAHERTVTRYRADNDILLVVEHDRIGMTRLRGYDRDP